MLINGGNDPHDGNIYMTDSASTYTNAFWTEDDRIKQVLDRLKLKDIEKYLRRKKIENLQKK